MNNMNGMMLDKSLNEFWDYISKHRNWLSSYPFIKKGCNYIKKALKYKIFFGKNSNSIFYFSPKI